jgi:hypothetical protein
MERLGKTLTSCTIPLSDTSNGELPNKTEVINHHLLHFVWLDSTRLRQYAMVEFWEFICESKGSVKQWVFWHTDSLGSRRKVSGGCVHEILPRRMKIPSRGGVNKECHHFLWSQRRSGIITNLNPEVTHSCRKQVTWCHIRHAAASVTAMRDSCARLSWPDCCVEWLTDQETWRCLPQHENETLKAFSILTSVVTPWNIFCVMHFLFRMALSNEILYHHYFWLSFILHHQDSPRNERGMELNGTT